MDWRLIEPGLALAASSLACSNHCRRLGWGDPDALPLSDAQLAQLKPMRGRPRSAIKRPMLSMRVDLDILEHLRASGKGWQTKVNALLRQAVEQGKV